MRYRALALDLDGTLLASREEVGGRNLAALAEAREAGLTIILASARWCQLAERIAHLVQAAPPVVACSCAQVRRLGDGRDLLDGAKNAADGRLREVVSVSGERTLS